MAKQSGMGDRLFVGGYDLSGDIGSLSRISAPAGVLDVTDITQSANSRLLGLRDGALEFTAYFDPATNASHDILGNLPTSDVNVSYFRGTTIGSPACSLVGKQLNYDGTRGADGSFTFNTSVQASAGVGLEWGNMLTAGIRTDTGATNGSSFDFTAASSFGWQAYLHVFGVTGTSVTVSLEDSANNSTWAALSGASFTAVTSGTNRSSQRLQSSSATATVRQYVRVVSSGTFNPASFAVVFIKNDATRVM